MNAIIMLAASAALASSGGGEHGGGHHDINWFELGGQIVTFLIFVGGLVYFMRKPASAFFLNRHETVKKAIEEARIAKAEAEAKAKEYQKKIDEIDSELKKVAAQFQASAAAEKGRLLAEAEVTAKRISRDAEQLITTELERAQSALRNDAAELAVKLAEDILKREIKADDQKRLVDDFLNTLAQGAKQKAA